MKSSFNFDFEQYKLLPQEEKKSLILKLNKYYNAWVCEFFTEHPNVEYILITGENEIIKTRSAEDPESFIDPWKESEKLGKLVLSFSRQCCCQKRE